MIALAMLERELAPTATPELPPPVRGLKPADPKWIVQVIRDARDGKR